MNKKILVAAVLAAAMLSAADSEAYVCKYCGEKFSSPTGVRTGYCTKNEKTHRHCLP